MKKLHFGHSAISLFHLAELLSRLQKTKIMASGPITSWQIDGETMGRVEETGVVLGPKSLQMVTAAMKSIDTCSLKEKL